jgi:hypothetical protein
MVGLALLGGLVASGGAFTASNTFTTTTDVAGYGSNAVTGATVTNVAYTTLSTDSSKLASVVFTVGTNITGDTATAQLLNSSSALVGASPYACTLGTWNSVTSTMSVTCATSDNPAIANVASTALSVHQ